MDLIELFMHWDAGRSKSELAVSLGMDRKTVAKYLAPAEAEGLAPGLGLSAEEWRDMVAGWFPTVADGRLRQITWPEFDSRIEWVREQLEAGVAGAVVHQRLVDEHGVSASQRSFYRWLAATMPDAGRAGRKPTVLKPPSAPGELGEVDYGMLGHWRDADTGRGHRVWAFVLTLPFSKQLFVLPTTRMDQTAWTTAHVAAFEFFGAVPRRITSDNLKTGVITPDLYDPKLNQAYAELAGHYGTLLDPARGNRPKDKPHVERMVQYVRGSFWAGRSFASMAQMRAEAERWCREVAGARKPRALAGQSPWEVLTAVERPAMVPLPPRRLEPAEWRTATVGSDCHASVRGVLYSLPHQLVGARLDVRLSGTTVEFHLDGAIAKVHPRIAKGRQTDLSDYPPAAVGFFTRDAAWCREHASLIGPAAAALVEGLLEEPAVHRIRAAQGIIRLAGTHRPEAVETACAAAAAAGDPTLKTVRGLLAAGVTVLPVRSNGDNGAGAYLRGPGAFTASIRDLANAEWVRTGQHVIISGPVGTGKTHIATAFGHQAVRAGHTVRFAPTSRVLADLAGGHADGSWAKRLRAYTKPDLLILDDFAMREFTPAQGDDLYEIVNERPARSIVVTTNRAPDQWYPLFPNQVVAESLLDRLVNNAHQITIQSGSYRARSRPTAH